MKKLSIKGNNFIFFQSLRFLLLLLFINGVLLATLFDLKREDNYEQDLFNAIVHSIKKDGKAEDKDTFLVRSLHMAYMLQVKRVDVFNGEQLTTLNHSWLHSATSDLMTAYGACGSYSVVLARVLKANNCQVKIVQMKVGNIWGGHILVEAQTKKNKWIVMDAMFDLVFHNPDGSFASFEEVHKNWEYFKNQVPPNYNYNYKYDDVRYTNWGKIPIVSTMVKNIFYLVLGKEKTDTLSIRPYLLRMHHFAFIILLFFYVLLTLYTIFKLFIFYRLKTHKNISGKLFV